MQLQNIIPVLLIILVAIIVILFSYINFKKWLTRKQVYIAVFAVILFISFISLKAAVHYNFLKFQSDFQWSSSILIASVFFILVSPVILIIYESIRKLHRKSVPIKDTPVSIPIFEEKIDTLPDKRSFGIINEETDEMNVTGAELEKPFEKITEISPMEQVLSNIESSSINEKNDVKITESELMTDKVIEEILSADKKQDKNIIPETEEKLSSAEVTVAENIQPKTQQKKTGSRSSVKKHPGKKTTVKTPKSRGTTAKKNKK
ncbi:MAG: hypothetical protein UZ05_CHB002000173 [Chlorobi bacterium OLB5]|nr:MAG: hypothetical protein UZ05_CHB002000173 [Chlorobi bacterium OLB5]